MTEKELLEMKIGEEKDINDCISVLRVPNGWIYIWIVYQGIASSFVPEELYTRKSYETRPH